MKNFKLTIEYDGTNYFGWQRQKDGSKDKFPTVQNVIEQAIRNIFGKTVNLTGSGRTDTGVHALGQTANFKVRTKLKCQEVKKAINAHLPEDVIVREVEEIPAGFHARYDAKSKWYRYTIMVNKKPRVFERNYIFFCPYKLDLKLMKKAAEVIEGEHDFSAVCKKKDKNSIRNVYEFKVIKKNDKVFFDINGNGFLYKMVRRLVGLIIEIGRGKIDLKDLHDVFLAKNNRTAIQTVPAKGLCLMQVFY